MKLVTKSMCVNVGKKNTYRWKNVMGDCETLGTIVKVIKSTPLNVVHARSIE